MGAVTRDNRAASSAHGDSVQLTWPMQLYDDARPASPECISFYQLLGSLDHFGNYIP